MAARLRKFPAGESEFIAVNDMFRPEYSCPTLERVGTLSDGGKWVCGVTTLLMNKVGCRVYSFGSGNETSFENEMVYRTPCNVYVFDPFISDDAKNGLRKMHERIHYHDLALGGVNGIRPRLWGDRVVASDTYATLDTIMRNLGHEWVDVLKIDVEGDEFDIFSQIFDSPLVRNARLPFGQIQIELHAGGSTARVAWLLLSLMKHGFRMFSAETNLRGRPPWEYTEYSFVQVFGDGTIG